MWCSRRTRCGVVEEREGDKESVSVVWERSDKYERLGGFRVNDFKESVVGGGRGG
jgi:hypothetical protein